MTTRLRLTQHAVRDLKEISEHYSGIAAALGARFTADLDVAIERMTLFPHGAPPVEGFKGLRRTRMRHSPYGIFYQQAETGELLIVRVLHSRRHHPGALR